MDELERRLCLKEALANKKSVLKKLIQIPPKSKVYVDTINQRKYWIDYILGLCDILTCSDLGVDTQWVICDEISPKSTHGALLFEDIDIILEILNTCIKENDLIFHYFAFWSDNNAVICSFKQYKMKDSLISFRLDFMITEKCSLRCEACLNLMQYYEYPRTYDLKKLKQCIDRIDQYWDEVYELRILGGEPFISADMYEICNYISHKKHIKYIVVFSNATILPDEGKLDLLSRRNCIFYLSDYGLKNQKTELISNVLKRKGFQTYICDFSAQKWLHFDKFEKLDICETKMDKLFQKCSGRTCPTLSDGQLYACEYLANASNLKAIPYAEENGIDLLQDEPDLKIRIRDYFLNTHALNGCHYCHRLIKNDVSFVPPAQQCKSSLNYKKTEGYHEK